jgi:uncharacterized membrane protein
MMKEIGRRLEGTTAAVFVLADDASVAAITAAIERDGHKVDYEVVPPEAQDLIKEAAKAAGALTPA